MSVVTSFGLKVGDAVHDDMMQEQRLVVDFYVSRQKAVEVLHIPADKVKAALSTILSRYTAFNPKAVQGFVNF